MRLTRQQYRDGFDPRRSVFREQTRQPVQARVLRTADRLYEGLARADGRDTTVPLHMPMPKAWQPKARRCTVPVPAAVHTLRAEKRAFGQVMHDFGRRILSFAITAWRTGPMSGHGTLNHLRAAG